MTTVPHNKGSNSQNPSQEPTVLTMSHINTYIQMCFHDHESLYTHQVSACLIRVAICVCILCPKCEVCKMKKKLNKNFACL